MKKTLVIGSAVADVIINLDHLPSRSEDVHVLEQKISLGGCAFNVSESIHHFGVPYIPFFPVGTGIYGDFIRKELAIKDVHSPIPSPQADNGCCYCFIEEDGERTFVSYHGAEYLFDPAWFDLLNPAEIERVYICGLEIEESTGIHIVEYLEKHPEYQIFFAPGPRLTKIDQTLAERIFALHPILHLNEDEALRYMTYRKTGMESSIPASDYTLENVTLAAAWLYEETSRPVIITWGKKGAYYYSADQPSSDQHAAIRPSAKDSHMEAASVDSLIPSAGMHHVPGVPAKAIDTNGAGDSHIGAVIACLQMGHSLEESIAIANRVSAKVVETKGAILSKEQFGQIFSSESVF